MPELYGQPFKWELRRQIDELAWKLAKEETEHGKTRKALDYARCEIAELREKIQRMEQKARELLGEAAMDDLDAKIWERHQELRRRRSEALAEEARRLLDAKIQADLASLQERQDSSCSRPA